MDNSKKNKNYKFVDNKAFTEDNVLVYNIFVYKIPKRMEEDKVREYFTQFGEVSKVRLVADKKRSRQSAPKVGFVHFSEPKAAAKALTKSTHQIQGNRVNVKACDSWQQPEMPNSDTEVATNGNAATAMNVDDATNNKTLPTLLQINDDCLEYIFKLVPLRDQVHLARVCQRFRNIFQMVSKLEYKFFDVGRLAGLTLWDTHEFFEVAGPGIETLVGELNCKSPERVVEFITKCCPAVTTVRFDSSKLKSSCLHKFLDKMKLVTKLELSNCSLRDNNLLAIKKMTNLKELTLSANYELTGKHLAKLPNVQKLSLDGCGNIQSTYFMEMCQSLSELQSLDIKGCDRLANTGTFEHMVTHCAKLETLKMSWADVGVARLSTLKHLELHVKNYSLGQRVFVALGAEHAPQLEHLTLIAKNFITYEIASLIGRLTKLKQLICANNGSLDDNCLRKFGDLENLEELVVRNCRAITNEGLLAVIRKCPKLRHVNVQSCNNINDAFVTAVSQVLNQRPDQKEPLVMLVARTGINQSFKYIATTSKLKLLFETIITMDQISHSELFIDLHEYSTDEEDYFDEDNEDIFADPFMYEFSDTDDEEAINNAFDMYGNYGLYGEDIY